MNVSIKAITHEIGKSVAVLEKQELSLNEAREYFKVMMEFGGRAAAICANDAPWGTPEIYGDTVSLERAQKCITDYHHSTQQHAYVSMLFTDLPKIGAMFLNNMRCYNTSEQSGRFTKFTGSGNLNWEAYHKWLAILEEEFSKVGKIPRQKIKTLAQENARYMLSPFEPTSAMIYTTTFCQWCYIVDWLKEYLSKPKTNLFEQKLVGVLKPMLECLEPYFGDWGIVDHRHRSPAMLTYVGENYEQPKEILGDAYLVRYHLTLIAFAQAHRHRILNYTMCSKGTPDKFYSPQIVSRSAYLQTDWELDLSKVADTIPGASMFEICEQGSIIDLGTKLSERLCINAQYEVRQASKNLVGRLWDARECLTNASRNVLQPYMQETPEGWTVIPRCQAINFPCSRPSVFCPDEIFSTII